MLELIRPAWDAPPSVQVIATTRVGGVSTGRYHGLNLSERVGDSPDAVARNQRCLIQDAGLPSAPAWLWQVHGAHVAREPQPSAEPPEADAAYTATPGRVLAIQVADCVPLVIASHSGGELAVAHAGWRGLVAGVLARTVGSFQAGPEQLMAWIGPCIRQPAYEIDGSTRASLQGAGGVSGRMQPSPRRADRWQADLPGIAADQLAGLGLGRVYDCGLCTADAPALFFSHRRDGSSGRQALLAWLGDAE